YSHINDVMKMSLSVAGLTMGIPIAMGTNKITGLGNGAGAQDAMAFGQKYTNVEVDARIVVQNTDPAGTIDVAIDALISTHKGLPNDHHTPTVGGDLTHDSITFPNGNANEQHLTAAQVAALHTIITVSDIAYNATTWNTNLDALTKNAIRDWIETHIGSATVHHTATVASDLNHNDLANLNAGTVYEHISAAQVAALHAAITVNAPIILTVQDIELKNDNNVRITEIDTDTNLAGGNTKVPTDAAAKAYSDAKISNAVYDGDNWNNITTIGASKDAIRDVVETLATALTYKGTWTPNGYPADPVVGDYYIVDTDGYKAADAPTPERWYEVGDWILWNGTTWDQLRNSFGDNVIAVAPGDDIQVAIDEIESVGNGVIFLMPGTHVLTATLTVNNVNVDIVIEGAGDSAVIDINGDRTAFNITNVKSCTFKNFKVDVSSLGVDTT
ncbi:hypothetical protein LCGC14_2675740, partial [marine sediment metagenome]